MSGNDDTPSVSWRWWLCESSNLNQLAEIDAYSKQMQLQLNAAGTVTGWMHLLDSKSEYLIPHQTALRCDRNNETVWSGPIFKTSESTASSGTGSQSAQDTNNFTAMGWFQILNQRLLHLGTEFQAMLTAPNGVAWQAANGAYTELGIDGAQTLAYSIDGNPNTTDATIIFDLLNRANIDSPTGITPGTIYGSPVQRNLTLQQFQNIGQEITNLINTEGGVDMYIDPVTRKMNLYGLGASPTPSIPNGMGQDRGAAVLFSLPGNCVNATRTRDGTMTANRVEAVSSNYGVGRADDPVSQGANGLFEVTDTLSDVTDINILIAYANEEITVLSNPWTIISFNPRGVAPQDAEQPGVPRPYDDYDIGDIVYARVDRGSFQVGSETGPQATRVFGWTLNIDDNNSVEKLTSIQTTYSGAGVS